MTSHIQPKESWRKQLDTLLWQNIDLRPREESHARPMSIGLVNQLENFISQAIAEAVEETEQRGFQKGIQSVETEESDNLLIQYNLGKEDERKRIEEAVKKMKTYTGGSSVNEKDKRVNKQEVLSIINQKNV